MIRGGISVISKGYAKANNRFSVSYNPNKLTSYIICSDSNNLYEHSMIKLFTFKLLDWVNPEKINFENYCDDSPIGCFLEVDFDYLDELHDLRNDYPLATEKRHHKIFFFLV